MSELTKMLQVSEGQTGQQSALAINTDVNYLFDKIKALEKQISGLTSVIGQIDIDDDDTIQTLTATAFPEATVAKASTSAQTLSVTVGAKYGSQDLTYVKDGTTGFDINLGDGKIYSSNGGDTVAGTVTIDDGGKLNCNFYDGQNGSFKFTFTVIYNPDRTIQVLHTITFALISSDANNALQIKLTPSSVMLTESTSGGSYNYSNSISTYQVTFNGKDVTDDTQHCAVSLKEQYGSGDNGCNCNGIIDKTAHTVQITGLTQNNSERCQTITYYNVDGVLTSTTKTMSGWLPVYVHYVDANGDPYDSIGELSFGCNHVGTYKETFYNDIHSQLSEKFKYDILSGQTFLTEYDRTEILQTAELICLSAITSSVTGEVASQLKVSAEEISSTVENVGIMKSQITQLSGSVTSVIEDVSGNTSQIKQTISSITAIVSGLSCAGIELDASNPSGSSIHLKADKTFVEDSSGNPIAVFSKDGGLSTEIINASKITAKELHVTGSTGSVDIDGSTGNLSANSVYLSGHINATNGQIGGLKIEGNGLTNEGFNNDAYIIMRNDPVGTFVGVGCNVLPASSGARAVGRFENKETNSYGTNYGILVYAENGLYNTAIGGTGNLSLNGAVVGWAMSQSTLSSDNTILELGCYNGVTELITNTKSNAGVTFPKLYNIRQHLSISSSKPFAIPMTIIASISTTVNFSVYGRNGDVKDSSGSYWMNNTNYAILRDSDGNQITSFAMGKGDVASFMLVWDLSEYNAYMVSNRN